MYCPYCNHPETKVIDSRISKDQSSIKRRRQCLKCSKRFTTNEKVLKLDLEVTKTDGIVEDFNLQKIKKGILKACEKRPVTLEQIEVLLDKILRDLKQTNASTIPTTLVGKIVMDNLKELDEVAFLKFALVHNNYSSVDEFMENVEELVKDEKKKNSQNQLLYS